VISAAQGLTQQLNSMTDGIQSLRSQAEQALSADVTQANNALQQIATLNQKLAGSAQSDSTTTALEDQRDSYIDQLAKLMDIRVSQGDHNQVTVSTTSGMQLVGVQASTLTFDARAAVAPQSQWSADPTKCTLGTITLTSPSGGQTDLVATSAIRSGEIAAYLEMRDQTLVQAQAQIDQFAAAISSALSDQQTAGTAVTAGAQNGFSIDVGSLSAGNSVNVAYTDIATGTQHEMTFVRVDDPSALPLPNTATINPNDTVVGIDFSGGMSSVVTQINAALGGTAMAASNPSGTTLQILDDGTATTTVDSLTATSTVTSLTGSVELPFFVDGSVPYTGAITAAGSQSVGFAGRMTVNSSLVSDPSPLVNYQTGTTAGDGTRPNFIYDQLVSSTHYYDPSSGVGTTSAPFSSTAGTYLSQIMSQQGEAASSASNLKKGQDVVLSSLQQRFDSKSGVNIDREMSDLLNLQNSYAANARVMSTIKDMLTVLMQM
jgi:flagellar hook-associated protein 1 FlgK